MNYFKRHCEIRMIRSGSSIFRSLRKYNTLSNTNIQDKLTTRPNHIHRLELWIKAKEKHQSLWLSPRVEQISVKYVGKLGPNVSLQMIKGISTPNDCAKHLSEIINNLSVIALVNGIPWDMHRPLTLDCSLDFVQFKDFYTDPIIVNRAFWYSSAFLLASVLENSFHNEHQVRLINIPLVEPHTGGFVCDISFNPVNDTFHNWIPSEKELRALSVYGHRLIGENLNFEPLDLSINDELFQMMFQSESFRLKQIKRELNKSASDLNSSNETTSKQTVSVYRIGNFVEVFNDGPLIRSTGLIGKFAVSSFKCLGPLCDHSSKLVYRVQALAIPSVFLTHFSTFNRLIQWSKLPNNSIEQIPDYVE